MILNDSQTRLQIDKLHLRMPGVSKSQAHQLASLISEELHTLLNNPQYHYQNSLAGKKISAIHLQAKAQLGMKMTAKVVARDIAARIFSGGVE